MWLSIKEVGWILFADVCLASARFSWQSLKYLLLRDIVNGLQSNRGPISFLQSLVSTDFGRHVLPSLACVSSVGALIWCTGRFSVSEWADQFTTGPVFKSDFNFNTPCFQNRFALDLMYSNSKSIKLKPELVNDLKVVFSHFGFHKTKVNSFRRRHSQNS